MRRQNYQPSEASSSSDNEKEEKTTSATSENNKDKEEKSNLKAEAESDDETSADSKPTLLFPFLKDQGLESAPLCRYFNLTIGASMSREENEGHAKTIQQLYPEWFDPRSSKQVRQNQHSLATIPMPMSDRLSLNSSQTSLPSPQPLRSNNNQTERSHQNSFENLVKKWKQKLKPRESKNDIREYLIAREKIIRVSGIDDQPCEALSEKSSMQSSFDNSSNNFVQDSVPHSKPSQSPIFTFPSPPRARKTGVSHRYEGKESTSKEDEVRMDASSSLLSLESANSPTHRPWCCHRAHSMNGSLKTSTPRVFTGSENHINCKARASLESTVIKSPSSWRRISPIQSTDPESSSTTPRNRKWSSISSLERRNSAIERLFSGTDSVGSLASPAFDSSGLVKPRRRRLSKKVSSPSVTLRQAVEEVSDSQALNRFRSIVRTVRIITGVCIALKSYVKKHVTRNWTFVEMYLHLQNDLIPSLAFDPNNFSKVQPPKGGRRLERLLSIAPERRTPLDIQNILAFVRSHETFQHFPSHLQVKLCMVMYYQRYEPRRIILREGHPPSAFYLVLSGSLIANISETSPTTGQTFHRTVADVKEGECFGEIALLEGSPRTASIVCKTRSELLVIYKDDFDRLILQPLIDQKKADVKYCVKQALFEEFDESVFYSNPQEFFYQYFPKDTIIVKDSYTCPFLILVKSGACKLIGSYKRAEYDRERSSLYSADLNEIFPLYAEMRRKGLAKDPWERTVDPDSNSTICQALEEGLLMGSIDKHTLRKALDATARPSTTKHEKERPQHPPRHRSFTLSRVFDQLEEERRQLEMSLGVDSDPGKTDYWSKKLAGSNSATSRKTRRVGRRQSEMWKIIQQETPSYAEIATLREGCVFGLETMVSVPGPSVTLVSEGAECLMVSKRLFLQHANIRSLRVAGDMVMTFPTAETLESKVTENCQWKRYKSDLVRRVIGYGVIV